MLNNFWGLLEMYAQKLQAAGNRLILASLEPGVTKEIEKSGTISVI